MVKVTYNDNEYDLEKLSKYSDYFKTINYESKENFIDFFKRGNVIFKILELLSNDLNNEIIIKNFNEMIDLMNLLEEMSLSNKDIVNKINVKPEVAYNTLNYIKNNNVCLENTFPIIKMYLKYKFDNQLNNIIKSKEIFRCIDRKLKIYEDYNENKLTLKQKYSKQFMREYYKNLPVYPKLLIHNTPELNIINYSKICDMIISRNEKLSLLGSKFKQTDFNKEKFFGVSDREFNKVCSNSLEWLIWNSELSLNYSDLSNEILSQIKVPFNLNLYNCDKNIDIIKLLKSEHFIHINKLQKLKLYEGDSDPNQIIKLNKNNKIEHYYSKFKHNLYDLCNKNLEDIKILIEEKLYSLYDIFLLAEKNENITILNWLKKNYDLNFINQDMYLKALKNGNILILSWLEKNYSLNIINEEMFVYSLFGIYLSAAKNGNILILDWLEKNYDLNFINEENYINIWYFHGKPRHGKLYNRFFPSKCTPLDWLNNISNINRKIVNHKIIKKDGNKIVKKRKKYNYDNNYSLLEILSEYEYENIPENTWYKEIKKEDNTYHYNDSDLESDSYSDSDLDLDLTTDFVNYYRGIKNYFCENYENEIDIMYSYPARIAAEFKQWEALKWFFERKPFKLSKHVFEHIILNNSYDMMLWAYEVKCPYILKDIYNNVAKIGNLEMSTYILSKENISELKKIRSISDDNIKNAVNLWCINKNEAIIRYGNINEWDVSCVTNMSKLFKKKEFNDDISSWDVSNVKDMSWMFSDAKLFNQPIACWDVSNVTNMSGMFASAKSFNQPINNWDVSNVIDMIDMFCCAESFNQPLNNWKVSNVTNMGAMFWGAESFNQPIGNWDVSNVTNMEDMFRKAKSFNQPLNNWKVSNVTNMGAMFASAESFNQPIGNWDVSNVKDMGRMFSNAKLFNQPIGNWDVSQVTVMNRMFVRTESFNYDISSWDVSNVKDMSWMFSDAKLFNQPIGNWDISKVRDMSWMFLNAPSFNQDISKWDISNKDIEGLLSNTTSFNKDLSSWNIDDDILYIEYYYDNYFEESSEENNTEPNIYESSLYDRGYESENENLDYYSYCCHGQGD
tara:strand:+ start:1892 stop:5110 length:3219 start_codon:yes stop_codon:yes gene_type:complete